MKKFLILSLFLISLPAFASCPIEEGGSCSIAELMNQPVHKNLSGYSSMVKDFDRNSPTNLQPRKNDSPERNLRDFGTQPSDYSYNANCQFGICNGAGAPKLFNGGRN